MQKNDMSDDSLVLVLAGAAAVVLIGPALMWSTTISWLIEHKVLVDATQHPLISLPHGAGAGLDARRVVVLGSALVVLIAAGWAFHARKEEQS